MRSIRCPTAICFVGCWRRPRENSTSPPPVLKTLQTPCCCGSPTQTLHHCGNGLATNVRCFVLERNHYDYHAKTEFCKHFIQQIQSACAKYGRGRECHLYDCFAGAHCAYTRAGGAESGIPTGTDTEVAAAATRDPDPAGRLHGRVGAAVGLGRA